MTTQEVQKAVRAIKAVSDDFEIAHAREDELCRQVLKAIANGAEDPAGLAKATLKATAVIFPRHTA